MSGSLFANMHFNIAAPLERCCVCLICIASSAGMLIAAAHHLHMICMLACPCHIYSADGCVNVCPNASTDCTARSLCTIKPLKLMASACYSWFYKLHAPSMIHCTSGCKGRSRSALTLVQTVSTSAHAELHHHMHSS